MVVWGILFLLTFKTQALFRRFGYIKGYLGEIFFCLLAVPYITFLIFFKAVKPVVIFKIGSSDYECDHAMKQVFEAG